MHIKKGDTVVVTTGKDKGKKGKITRAFPSLNQVLIEGINFKKVTRRAKKQGEKSAIVSIEYPVNASNVKLAK